MQFIDLNPEVTCSQNLGDPRQRKISNHIEGHGLMVVLLDLAAWQPIQGIVILPGTSCAADQSVHQASSPPTGGKLIASPRSSTMPFLKDDDDTPPGEADTLAPLLPSPGRDPSRLMQDIAEHSFEDHQIHSNPPLFDPTKPHKSPEPAHTHSWIIKTWSGIKDRPWNAHAGGSSIVALCEICRMHMALNALITSDDAPVCGSQGTDPNSHHHFHLELWTNNTRYSSKATAVVERKPEYGTFQCCQCPLAIQIEYWSPVVPEYLLSSFKKRKTGNNSALNIINRNKDAKPNFATVTKGILQLTPTEHLRLMSIMFSREVRDPLIPNRSPLLLVDLARMQMC